MMTTPPRSTPFNRISPRPLAAPGGFFRRHRAAGFSLVELLTVIAIVAILAAVSSTAFNSIGRGQGADGASTVASSLALGARVEAMKKGRGALLAIDATYDADNPERYLRRFVLFGGVETNGEVRYEVAGKPLTLPQGVNFLPEYSDGYTTNQLDLQAIEPQATNNGSHNWLVYEFSGSGHLVAPATGDSRLVFGPAITDGSGNVDIPDSMAAKRRGFLLRNNGRPAFFETTNQMPPVQ